MLKICCSSNLFPDFAKTGTITIVDDWTPPFSRGSDVGVHREKEMQHQSDELP
jgi:hypothetical protein